MRKALVTGASGGIGRSIAIKLSNAGFSLVLCGRNESNLKETAALCSGQTEILAFDLNDANARDQALDKTKDVDVVINNAGIWHKVGNLETLDDQTVLDVINSNLTSQILLTKKLLPAMRHREGTAVINIISKSGITAQLGQSVYTASKYGMRGFTDVLREDTKEDPIRIGAVYQAGTNTQMFEKAGEDFPIENFTEPDDLADVVVFMLTRPKKIWLNEVRVVN